MIPPSLFQEIYVSYRPHFHFLTALHKPTSGQVAYYSGTVKDRSFTEAVYLLVGRVPSVRSHFLLVFELA